jgi:3-hydroxybutyryl-CoA dehydrogenase
MTHDNLKPSEIPAGVVGLGLMGSSIAVALLISGHPVKAIAPMPEDAELGPVRIKEQLSECHKSGLLNRPVEFYISQLTVSEDYSLLKDCRFVLECVSESMEIKKKVYKKISSSVCVECIIATNTSAIPISILQQLVSNPGRFMGVHWAEPAYMTRFLEITCGNETSLPKAEWMFSLATHWKKEPTILRKDIRGFVTNRLMYAIYREALQMVNNGETTIEDADKSFHYDAGSWMTLMGVFKRMDFMGLEDYNEFFKNIFPKLNNDDRVPEIMQNMVNKKAKGIKSSQGLYKYTKDEAKEWEERFALFNKDIFELAAKYPCDIVDTRG